MEVKLGDICYPKSKALIIPSNVVGVMTLGVGAKIAEAASTKLVKEVKEYVADNKLEVGENFSTCSGKLKRRGVDRVYHVIIKRLQNDFTSIYIVRNALNKVMSRVVRDNMESVTLCGIGIEHGDLDQKTIARVTVDICRKYDNHVKIKIIDDRKEFITEVDNLIKE